MGQASPRAGGVSSAHWLGSASEITAFAIAVLTPALWTATERSPALRARLAGLLPFAWCDGRHVRVGLAQEQRGPFDLFAMATVGAGNAFSLAVAGTITGTGVLAVGSAGLVFGIPMWQGLFYSLTLVLGLLFGRLERGYRLQAGQSAALLANAEQLRQEQGRSATLDERNRIAREIHDLLARSLGSLAVQIQAAQAVLTDQHDIDRAVELLGYARRTATEGLNETRRAVHALHAGTPPLPEVLANLSSGHQRRYGARVSFEVTSAPRSLSLTPVWRSPAGTRVPSQYGQAPPASDRRAPARLPRRSHCAYRRQRAPLRIVVADDQASVREGLVLLLGLLPDIEVVASAADGRQAIDLVTQYQPDAILLDLRMPVIDGIEATRQLTELHPAVAIVVLTTYAADTSILAALRAGARSYLTKDADRVEIASALRSAVSGLSVLDPKVRPALLAAATQSDALHEVHPAPPRGAARRAHQKRGRNPGDDGTGHDQPTPASPPSSTSAPTRSRATSTGFSPRPAPQNEQPPSAAP